MGNTEFDFVDFLVFLNIRATFLKERGGGTQKTLKV